MSFGNTELCYCNLWEVLDYDIVVLDIVCPWDSSRLCSWDIMDNFGCKVSDPGFAPYFRKLCPKDESRPGRQR